MLPSRTKMDRASDEIAAVEASVGMSQLNAVLRGPFPTTSALVLGIGLLLLACSGSALDIGASAASDAGASDSGPASTPPGTGNDGGLAVGPPLAAADFCASYTLAVCKALEGCCGSPPAGTFDQTTCVSVVRSECDGALTSAPATSSSYVPELGASCVAKAASEVCAAQVYVVSSLCPALFQGHAPAGASCNTVYRSCAEGLACAPQPLADAGQCTGTGPQPCDPASSEACTSLPTGGQPCFQGYESGLVLLCADGFACKSNVCEAVHFAAAGAPCTDIEQCATGLFCDAQSKTCAVPRGEAEPCVDHTGCASDVCTDHVCTPAQRGTIPFCKG